MYFIELSLQERQRLSFSWALLLYRCFREQASGSCMALLLQGGKPCVADILADIALTMLGWNSPPKAGSCIWRNTFFAKPFFHMGWKAHELGEHLRGVANEQLLLFWDRDRRMIRFVLFLIYRFPCCLSDRLAQARPGKIRSIERCCTLVHHCFHHRQLFRILLIIILALPDNKEIFARMASWYDLQHRLLLLWSNGC